MTRQSSRSPTVDELLQAAGELTVKELLRRGGDAALIEQERCFEEQLQAELFRHGQPPGAEGKVLRSIAFPARYKPGELKN